MEYGHRLSVSTKNYSFSLVTVLIISILFVSVASGVHRTLLAFLYQNITGSSFGPQLIVHTSAPLVVWLTLALSLAPFGLAKSLSDWIGGIGSDRLSAIFILRIGAGTSLVGIFLVIIALLTSNSFSGEFKGIFGEFLIILGTGFIGVTEGLFFAAAILRLTKMLPEKSRGFAVGLMEASVYTGYTIGTIITGLLESNTNLLFPYICAFIASFFALVLCLTQHPIIDPKSPEELKLKLERQKYSLRVFIRRPRVLSLLFFAHIGKFADAFVWLLPLFLTTKLIVMNNNNQPDIISISIILSVYTATWAVMMLFSARTSDLLGRKWFVIIGFSSTFFGLIGFSLLNSPIELIIASLLLGFGTGLFYPVLSIIAIDIVVRPAQGEMVGIFRSIRDFGYFTGAFIICILAWVFGGKLEDLSVVGLLIALLMLFSAFLQTILIRESHPPWHLLDRIIEHAKLSNEITSISCSVFSQEKFSNKDIIKETVSMVEALESKSDNVKRDIRTALMSSILPTADVSLFLEIVRVNDLIAGRAVIAATKLQFIPITYLPKTLTTTLSELGIYLSKLMSDYINALVLLEDQIYLARQASKIIFREEPVMDKLYSQTLALLYFNEPNYPSDERFTIMMTLKECADALENAADYVEDAADLIAILGAKYKP